MEYAINVDEYKLIGIYWIAFYVNDDNRSAPYDATYFGSFRVEYIAEKIKKGIAHKIIMTNIFRIQAYGLIMCGYFCIGLIDSKL